MQLFYTLVLISFALYQGKLFSTMYWFCVFVHTCTKNTTLRDPESLHSNKTGPTLSPNSTKNAKCFVDEHKILAGGSLKNLALSSGFSVVYTALVIHTHCAWRSLAWKRIANQEPNMSRWIPISKNDSFCFLSNRWSVVGRSNYNQSGHSQVRLSKWKIWIQRANRINHSQPWCHQDTRSNRWQNRRSSRKANCKFVLWIKMTLKRDIALESISSEPLTVLLLDKLLFAPLLSGAMENHGSEQPEHWAAGNKRHQPHDSWRKTDQQWVPGMGKRRCVG